MNDVLQLSKEEKKILGLSALGGMLELYDFAIYGTFAIYFSKLFFPSDNSYITLLETYMVFMLGFILRPVGGLLFSHLGDEFGRKKVLVFTILLMGVSSIGIACLPTYGQIGITATILLLCMRLLQGLAVGGELPTTFVYISESMTNKRILAFGITMTGVFSGYLFAALINFIMTELMTKEQIIAYGWRIPFLIGGIICFISFKIRQSLRETKAFQEIMSKPKLPLLQLFRQYKMRVVAGVILSATQQVFSVVGIMYMPSFFSTILKLDSQQISNLMPLALFASVVTILSLGIWFRRTNNYYKLLVVFLVVNIIFVPIAFYLMCNSFATSGYVLFMIVHALVGMMVPLYITLLFPTNVRLSGVAVSYNISIAAFGGTAPLAITMLIKNTGHIFAVPVLYLSVFFVLALIATLLISRRLFSE